MKKTVSVVSPCLNEAQFLPFWLENVAPWADEIIVVDGDSTDNSIDIIKEAQKDLNIKLIVKPQQGNPYSTDWKEDECRNLLLDNCTMDYVLSLDIDEVISDSFKEFKEGLYRYAYAFNFVSFWKDFKTVRLNHPVDPRWEGHHLCLWKNNPNLRYVDKHHCTLENFDNRRITYVDDVALFHIHYAVGLKYRDNRRGDVGYGHTDLIDGEPDWNFLNKGDYVYKLVTKPYEGKYPKALERAIKNQGDK